MFPHSPTRSNMLPICSHMFPHVPIGSHMFPHVPTCSHQYPACSHKFPHVPTRSHMPPYVPICSHQYPTCSHMFPDFPTSIRTCHYMFHVAVINTVQFGKPRHHDVTTEIVFQEIWYICSKYGSRESFFDYPSISEQ